MSTINISGTTPVEDPSYRYKMPRVLGKIEGKGNGIKTVIVNVVELGQALNREPAEITKFFGCEVGSQTTYAADTDRAIVNGAHIDSDLQKNVHKYIELFVLCKTCRLPETHYKIKDGQISQKCLACGGKDLVDMTHRLTTFILSQHKKAKEIAKAAEKAAGKDGKKKDKEGKKDKKEKKKSGDDNDATNGEADAPVKKEKKDKDGKKKSSKKDGSSPTSSTPENVFGITAGEEDEEEESDSRAADEAMDRLKLWLSDNATHTVTQLLDELRNIQTMASLRPADRIIIYLGAVLTENVVAGKEIAAHKEVLGALAATAIQERHLIAAVEWLCGTRYPSLVKYFPVLLKQLLDEELVDEDTFFAWAGDFARNEFSAEQSMMCIDTLEHLKASAAPFIKWLQEAEEEGEDNDEEEEEDSAESVCSEEGSDSA